jgi:hypothetical protein
MRFLVATLAALLVSPALAYDLKNLSQQDVLVIGEALDAMPHGKVAGLYNRIQQQLTAEDQAGAAEVQAKAEKAIRDKIKSETKSESKKDKPNE